MISWNIIYVIISFSLQCFGNTTITISGSRTYPVQNEPFTFTCTFTSAEAAVRELLKNEVRAQAVQLGGNDGTTCYNTTGVPVICDPTSCSCSQQNGIFTASWTLSSVNDALSKWKCSQTTSQSTELELKIAIPVTSVRLDGITGSQIPAVSGMSKSLTCITGESRPRSYVQWYIGGMNYTINSTSTVTNGQDEKKTVRSVLTFTPTRDMANMAVNCKAFNIYPNASVELQTKPTLDIQYPPTDTSATIVGQASTITVTEGVQVNLQCRVRGGNPLASITWSCFGGTVIDTSVNGIAQSMITFIPSSSQNGQTCTCRATHPAAQINNDTVQLNVEYRPKVVSIKPPTTSYTVEENKSFGPVTCSADCNPPCTYIWSGPTTINNANLTFGRINRNEEGTYKCTATNTVNSSTKAEGVEITVNYGPDPIILNPSTLNYIVNETYQLGPVDCSAVCKPMCGYRWTGPGTDVSGSTLMISNINRNNTGTYRCTASNYVSNRSSQDVVVTVHYAAELKGMSISGGNFTIPEHSKSVISCSAEGLPWPTITLRSDTNNSVIERLERGLILKYTFPSARCEDIGNYSCEAVNTFAPKQPIQRSLFVLCSPRLNGTAQKEYAFGSGETLNILSTIMAYPQPKLDWFFQHSSDINKTLLSDGQRNVNISIAFEYTRPYIHVTQLTRKSLQENNFGIYSLTSSNIVGNKTEEYSVVANGRPNKPSGVQVECLNYHSAQITWTSEFNNGRKQSFQILLRAVAENETVSDIIEDPGQKKQINRTIFKLEQSSQYFFSVIAFNEFGRTFSTEVNCTTSAKPEESNLTGVAVGAACGSAVVVILVTITMVFLYRRNKLPIPKGKSTEKNGRSALALECRENNDEDEMRDNILYESAGEDFAKPAGAVGGKNDYLYADVQKNKDKNVGKTPDQTAVYAEVQKKTKKATKSAVDPSAIYAEVQKPNKKPKNEKKQKNLFGKEKSAKTEKGTAYENVGDVKSTQNGGDMMYANADDVPGPSGVAVGKKTKQPKTKNQPKRNKDGLIYADLELDDQPKPGQKLVIHGLENKTDYAEVDFSKKAPEEDKVEKQADQSS